MSGSVTEAIRAELRRRTEERGTRYSAEFTEVQAVELASGFVSAEVRAIFLSMLAWMDEDRIAESRAEADRQKKKRKLA